MKNICAFLLILCFAISYSNADIDVNRNIITENDTNVKAEPGCTDPMACNYDATATEDSGNCSYECISPEVLCPEDKEIYLCVPNTTPPPLNLIDFIPSGNSTLLENLLFNPEQSDGVNPNFTLTIYSYVIEDSRGNQRACIQRFYNTNKPIDGPEVETTIDLCQDQLWSFIEKPFLDNYRFYSDNRGTPDQLLRVCEFPYSVCPTANFGLNTSETGTAKFWITSFIRFTEDEICESLPVLITVNIRPKPEASLIERNRTLQVGQYINLSDAITGDKSGFWKGDGIVSFSIPNGDTWYFFGSNAEGVHKLYYTINNDFCSKTLILVVDVVNGGANQKRINLNGVDNLKVYPNPSTGSVFVQASSFVNQKLSITVIDINGKMTFFDEKDKVDKGLVQIDLSHLPKGVYMIEMKNQYKYKVEKLVLK